MFLIIGTKGMQQDKGFVASPHTCPRCSQQMYPKLLKFTRYLSFFFIPIIPFNSKHYLICSHCGYSAEIPNDQAKQLPLSQ